MDVAARVQPSVIPPAGMQTQTSSGSPSEKQKKPFDPQQLKDEQASLSAARELADAHTDSAERASNTAASSDIQTSTTIAAPRQDSAEWSRTEGAPNWSSLSASSKGYTMTERAINLYRHISAMPM
ncbi:MAG: hypothetical protein JJU03_01475 [Idiomarina sp.]|nr:hypothetical protein [Idiomarina sp.]